MAEKQSFPMLAESNWWALRQQFKKTIPATVTVNYLKSLLGLTSDQSARNILSPLKQMKIIDESGKPLQRANDWRNDEKYSQVCKEIVLEIYPVELIDLFPENDVDILKAKNWFMDTCTIGDSAASKTVAMFSLLKSGQIKDTMDRSAIKKVVKNENNRVGKDKVEAKKIKVNKTEPKEFAANRVKPTVHIDLQIHISPEASTEQIDTIFASIAKHLYERR